VARGTERETRDAYLGVIAEIARVQALARSEDSNRTALEATEAGYQVGTRTTVDVLNQRQSLFLSQTQYARSKYDYLINVLRLKQAAGTLSEQDVTLINNWLVVSEALPETPGRGITPDAKLPATVIDQNTGEAKPLAEGAGPAATQLLPLVEEKQNANAAEAAADEQPATEAAEEQPATEAAEEQPTTEAAEE
jgi:hypothetical protein